MYYDYFLMHRALQIQKLRAAKDGPRLELPKRLARSGASTAARQLSRALETIAGWDFGDKPQRGRWSWLKVRSHKWWPKTAARDPGEERADAGEQLTISADQRAALNELETALVRARLGDDDAARTFAATLMQALWRDSESFNGLKPLAFHSEQFVYEFLYPTWFNLYTVLTAADQRQAKFTTAQVKTIFDFLEAYERGGTARDPELVGLMTFLANRYPAEEAQDLLQRLLDLCGCPASDLSVAAAVTVRPLREWASTLAEFHQLLRHYLLVESCRHREALRPIYHLARPATPDRPLPEAIGAALGELALEADPENRYRRLVQAVGRVVTVGGFAEEFGEVLAHPVADAWTLLSLVVPEDEQLRPLSPAGQRLLARLLLREGERGGTVEVARVRPFAREFARRIDGLHRGLETLVQVDFLDDAARRAVLLDSLEDRAKRTRLAARLAQAAKQTEAYDRFLDLVELVAVLDPAYADDSLRRIRQTLQVLRLTIEDGTIVRSQLADLIQDLQAELPASLRYLQAPARAAQSKAGRLRNLYRTLEEQRAVYARAGELGNFSKRHAALQRAQRVPATAARKKEQRL